jgi:hypothetical protein
VEKSLRDLVLICVMNSTNNKGTASTVRDEYFSDYVNKGAQLHSEHYLSSTYKDWGTMPMDEKISVVTGLRDAVPALMPDMVGFEGDWNWERIMWERALAVSVFGISMVMIGT